MLLAALALACDGGAQGEGGASGGGTPHQRAAERAGFAGRPFPVPVEKPDFVLQDTTGSAFDFRDGTQDRVTVLFFGYSHCPDICPAHLSNVAGAMQRDPELRERVRVVFVGVDRERDTPERLRTWLDYFDPSFVGLTGSEAELAAAQRASGVLPAQREVLPDGEVAFSHPAWMTVYTDDGWGRIRYPIDTTPEVWARDLGWLARRGWPEG